KKGKVRAPEHARGQSATCPNCQNCFTIVEPDEPQAPLFSPTKARAAAPAPAPPTTVSAETSVTTQASPPRQPAPDLEPAEIDAIPDSVDEALEPVEEAPSTTVVEPDEEVAAEPDLSLPTALIGALLASFG